MPVIQNSIANRRKNTLNLPQVQHQNRFGNRVGNRIPQLGHNETKPHLRFARLNRRPIPMSSHSSMKFCSRSRCSSFLGLPSAGPIGRTRDPCSTGGFTDSGGSYLQESDWDSASPAPESAPPCPAGSPPRCECQLESEPSWRAHLFTAFPQHIAGGARGLMR